MNKMIGMNIQGQTVIEIETTLGPFDGIYIAIKKAREGEEMKRILEFVKRSGGCGRKIISIFPDGSVKPCQFIDFIDLGNIRREHLSSIIRNLEKEPYRVFIEPWKYVRRGKCAQCQFLQYCGGGDRIRAYYLEGSLDASDPYCPIPVLTSQT